MSEGTFPGEEGASLDEAVPKIRVYWSDGKGTATWNQRVGPEDRSWLAPPAADYTESLYASASGMFLRCFHSKRPSLSGSVECGDLCDADSFAVHLTPAEAVDWLVQHGYRPPDDLKSVADVGQPQANGQPKATVAARMIDLIKDPTTHVWTAEQFRLKLGCKSRATITATAAWKQLAVARESARLRQAEQAYKKGLDVKVDKRRRPKRKNRPNSLED